MSGIIDLIKCKTAIVTFEFNEPLTEDEINILDKYKFKKISDNIYKKDVEIVDNDENLIEGVRFKNNCYNLFDILNKLGKSRMNAYSPRFRKFIVESDRSKWIRKTDLFSLPIKGIENINLPVDKTFTIDKLRSLIKGDSLHVYSLSKISKVSPEFYSIKARLNKVNVSDGCIKLKDLQKFFINAGSTSDGEFNRFIKKVLATDKKVFEKLIKNIDDFINYYK